MQMLKNQGNEEILFDAKYQRNFSLVQARQTGSTPGFIEFKVNSTSVSTDGIDVYRLVVVPSAEFHPSKSSSDHRSTQIYGLSMLTHSNPAQWPIKPGL